MTDIITLENIDVTFKQGKQIVNAVKNVNLNVEKGDIFGVVGYSGAGKSTLVRTINLLQKPTSGTVKVNGTLLFADNKQQISNKELQKQRRSIGMIFQHFNLLNETTVVDNVAFALRHSSLSDKEIEEKKSERMKAGLIGFGGAAVVAIILMILASDFWFLVLIPLIIFEVIFVKKNFMPKHKAVKECESRINIYLGNLQEKRQQVAEIVKQDNLSAEEQKSKIKEIIER